MHMVFLFCSVFVLRLLSLFVFAFFVCVCFGEKKKREKGHGGGQREEGTKIWFFDLPTFAPCRRVE